MIAQEIRPLLNPSFEGEGGGEWWRRTYRGQEFGNIFVPVDWTFFFRDGPVPWDPSNKDGFQQPEAKVIHYEDPYINPPRIVHGEWGFQMFGFFKAVDGGLYQTVPTRDNDLLTISFSVHAWTSQDDDPRTSTKADGAQARFYIGFNPEGVENPWAASTTWSEPWSIYDQFQDINLSVRATGPESTIFIRAQSKYPFKHNDFYIDHAQVMIDRQLDDTKPREGWRVKRMLVLPTEDQHGKRISQEVWHRGGQWAYEHDLMDYGNSPDSACHAPGVDSVGYYLGMITPEYPDPEDYRQFNREHYPGCELLGTVALYESGEDPPQPPPEPPPDDGIDVPVDQRLPPLKTDNLTMGIHMHAWHDDEGTFMQLMQSGHPPSAVKALGGYELGALSRALPSESNESVLRVLRTVPGGDHGYAEAADKRQAALNWLDFYSYKLEETVRRSGGALGVGSVSELLDLLNVPVLESVNECVGTYAEDTGHTVEFELEFMRAVEERYGDQARAGILTVAIGNPAMDELDRLLPAIERACRARPKHLIAHHQAYWGMRPYGETFTDHISPEERVHPQLQNPPWYWLMTERGVWEHRRGTPPRPSDLSPLTLTYRHGLERHWPWLAGRAMVWFDYFSTRHGLYFEHYAGEGGALTTPGDCGPGVLGGKPGWREGGSWDYIAPQLSWYNLRWQKWNERHGNLFHGMTYFTHKWWGGWSTFWMLGGEHLDWLDLLGGGGEE